MDFKRTKEHVQRTWNKNILGVFGAHKGSKQYWKIINYRIKIENEIREPYMCRGEDYK